MSTKELRKVLIEKIQLTNDPQILEEIYRILQMGVETSDVYKLSEDQLSAIEIARKQVEKGEFLTDEQSNQEIDKWLEK